MTDPSYPAAGYPAPTPRSRPTTVTVASYLLYAVAAIQLINALIVFSTTGPMRDAAEAAYAGTDAEGAEGFVVGALIAGGVINLIIGAGFAVLSFFNSKGKNPSRIVTWVVGGISLCCLGAGLGGNALVSGMDSGSTTGPSQDEVARRMEEATPSWYTPTTTTLTVIGLLAILGAVILLALPASNDFFRKPVAGAWDPYQQQPPYPGQPYPGQPYPGQPYPGQSYPGQAYPGQQPYPGPQGQPGQPAPGLPPYPGQSSAPPSPNPFTPQPPPPASDPFAPPASGPSASGPASEPPSSPGDEQPPRPPA